MKTLTDIRAAFLDFFRSNRHTVVESSPLVPRNDPTLMFTNSGMVQFKNVFTGAETRPYTRAATAQKCVRAGGKHNDLENVGYTARHLTFFEMLGNFSFGDYFKDVAVELAWKLVTREFGLDKNRLLVTVFAEDDEAAKYWKKISGLGDDKIIRIASSDNFWQMGDLGPCGPCSEIFYDHGPSVAGGPPGSKDADGDRFVEIWNLVFMQYEQVAKDKRVNLPRPSIDTGMGLDRVSTVMQGVHSVFEIDLFKALINASEEFTHTRAEGERKASHRVIADHLRAASFLMADGVMPGNDGRGYVLRRIMRRAMRHAHLLGAKEPLLYRMAPELVSLMGTAYPELGRAEPLITETLKLEEARFKQTLERGLKLLDEETAKLAKGRELPGEVAFKLYDTFGFPLDLTQDVLRGQGRGVDTAGFTTAMEKQKAEARRNWAGSGEAAPSRIWLELREELGATEFLGYSTEKAEGLVQAIIKEGKRVKEAGTGDDVALILNQTPFYAESGGQHGDAGILLNGGNARIRIDDTRKEADGLFVHHGQIEKGNVREGEALTLLVGHERRTATRANHSATHLMHEALRRTLGAHVTQKGSLVTHERLRFDFSHPAAMKPEQIKAVETLVNTRIRANDEVETRLLTPDVAMKEGAIAMFGEKYGEEVRVLSMGGREEGQARPFSMELCGGTHVRRTGDIGIFKIVGESAVAAGVRRIEAVTGVGALAYFNEQERLVRETAEALRAAPSELPQRAAVLMEERRKLERDVADLRRQAAMGGGGGKGDADNTKLIDGIYFNARVIHDIPPKDLKPIADAMKQAQDKNAVVALAAVWEGKVSLVVSVTDDLTKRVNAVELVKAGAAVIGGKGGGGRPDMAQAGGSEVDKVEAALGAIETALRRCQMPGIR